MGSSLVVDVYLRVIDGTIEGVKAELEALSGGLGEEGGQVEDKMREKLETLEELRQRWAARVAAELDGEENLRGEDGGLNEEDGAGPEPDLATGADEDVDPRGEDRRLEVNDSVALPSVAELASGKPRVRAGEPLPSIGTLPHIPQVDGADGEDEPDSPDHKRRKKSGREDENGDNADEDRTGNLDDEELGSGDDEDVDDGGVDDMEIENYVLAQHDKVISKKQKWKVLLRDGVVHVNDREYLFSRMQCELEW